MKMGDSLGRNRKRRRGGSSSPPPPLSGDPIEGGVASEGLAPAGAVSGSGSAVPPRTEVGRSRARSGPRSTILGERLQGWRLLGVVGGLALFGWLFGYGVATQLFFPAPPPPGDLFQVPDLNGLGMASAVERLSGSGLEIGPVDSLQHPSVPAGIVIGQSPLPTQVARPDTPIRVTVSAGPQTRSIPDVRRLAEERARVVLEASGFVVTVVTAEGEEPRGHVISMSPAQESVVSLPSQVQLVVSAGPPVVTMPDLLMMTQVRATEVLDSLGLEVDEVEEVFRFGRDQGIVVEQDPPVDTRLERGSGVRLKVGRRGIGSEH